MALGVSEATLIAVLLEAVLFGAFTILYAITAYILVPKSGKPLNLIALAVSSAMYALAFSHLAINIERIVLAFIKFTNEQGGSDGFLAKPSDPLYVAQISVYCAQTILGDAFMIYRLSIVWSGNKVITAPAFLCFLASIAAGIGGPHAVARASPTDLIYVAKVKHWGTAFYSITLATNLMCTVLIALRIWWIGRRCSAIYKSRSFSPALVIIIESGAVYSAILIAVIVTYTINDWSHYFFLDAICPVIGLVFTAIIVRIGLGVSTEDTPAGSVGFRKGNVNLSVRPVAVEMTRTTTTPNDIGEPLDLSRIGSLSDALADPYVKVSRNCGDA